MYSANLVKRSVGVRGPTIWIISSRIGMVGPAFMNVVIEGTLRPNTGFQAKINKSGMTSTAIKDPLTLAGKCIGLYIV